MRLFGPLYIKMRVAIIGGGAAGLTSAKHVVRSGFKLDLFEMGPELGGTWVYTNNVGKDEYGYPVYNVMYKGLRTNLPKEVMGFPDFPIPEQGKSYLTQAEVLEFLNLYADHFDLRKYIKFNTMVKDVRPEENLWKVTSVHKPSGEVTENIYDAVMICNGHYTEPVVPKLEGQELFKGNIDHSHNYRDPERFKGKQVLVIGGGPSALDITVHVSSTAKYVALSHHITKPFKTKFPPNVELKPDVQRVLDFSKIEFIDKSCCCFDEIIFCTGYEYSFPFLHDSCNVTVEENHIQPLYKHMIHIERPTMCFIGMPYDVVGFPTFDLQARYFCKYLSGSMSLPSPEEMRKHTEQDIKDKMAKGFSKRQMHRMGPFQQAYYNSLAEEANTTSIPPVLGKLRDLSGNRRYEDFINFRDDRYKIVDDNSFIKVPK